MTDETITRDEFLSNVATSHDVSSKEMLACNAPNASRWWAEAAGAIRSLMERPVMACSDCGKTDATVHPCKVCEKPLCDGCAEDDERSCCPPAAPAPGKTAGEADDVLSRPATEVSSREMDLLYESDVLRGMLETWKARATEAEGERARLRAELEEVRDVTARTIEEYRAEAHDVATRHRSALFDAHKESDRLRAELAEARTIARHEMAEADEQRARAEKLRSRVVSLVECWEHLLREKYGKNTGMRAPFRNAWASAMQFPSLMVEIRDWVRDLRLALATTDAVPAAPKCCGHVECNDGPCMATGCYCRSHEGMGDIDAAPRAVTMDAGTGETATKGGT